MNEKMSFNMDVKFTVSLYMGRVLKIYCILRLEEKCEHVNS